MSIASAIQNAQQKVTNAYTAVNNKGGTLPATQNLSNLPNAISSIPTGSTPTGTISITQNGTYDVTNYASANVNVSGSGGIGNTREISTTGVYQMPTTSFTFSLPSTATDLGRYAMYYAFHGCTGITTANLSSLTTISNQQALFQAFTSCSNLTSINLSNLTTVSGSNAMSGAFSITGVTSADLSSLTTVSGSSAMTSLFANSGNFASVDLSSLSSLTGSSALKFCFQGTALTSLSFPALTSNSFGSYTNQFNYMLQGVTGCTVHFPSNLQSVIGSWSDVTVGFAGTRTTVLFDLPATT